MARLILGRFPGWAWHGGLGYLSFGDVLDNLWYLLGAALRELFQGTDFVLFSWLLLWMLAAFWRMLFYSLINPLEMAVVRRSGLSSGCCSTFVGLLLG